MKLLNYSTDVTVRRVVITRRQRFFINLVLAPAAAGQLRECLLHVNVIINFLLVFSLKFAFVTTAICVRTCLIDLVRAGNVLAALR